MPLHGYAAMFSAMVSRNKLSIRDWRPIWSTSLNNIFDRLIFTGPIRWVSPVTASGHWHTVHSGSSLKRTRRNFVQPVPQINYPNDYWLYPYHGVSNTYGPADPKTTLFKNIFRRREPYYQNHSAEGILGVVSTLSLRSTKNFQQSSLRSFASINTIIWIKSWQSWNYMNN